MASKNKKVSRGEASSQSLQSLQSLQPLPFEKPLLAMQEKIEELEQMSIETGTDFSQELKKLKQQANEIRGKLYENLSPANRLQIARHPQRPNLMEIIKLLSPEVWVELHGDRAGHDDRAIIGGLIRLNGKPMMVVGTQKGRGMKENLYHNFGMANPEGYRKALRLFAHAEKFNLPVLTIIDTPGAYPGMDGEQNGIGQAIATNIREMARLRVPILSLVIGEASSGGALGIGVADRIYMLEHAMYTVISPEGCASILWRSAEYAARAAEALKISAEDLHRFGIIDEVIPEPVGGAHHDPGLMVQRIRQTLTEGFETLQEMPLDGLIQQRYQKYRKIGAYSESVSPSLAKV